MAVRSGGGGVGDGGAGDGGAGDGGAGSGGAEAGGDGAAGGGGAEQVALGPLALTKSAVILSHLPCLVGATQASGPDRGRGIHGLEATVGLRSAALRRTFPYRP